MPIAPRASAVVRTEIPLSPIAEVLLVVNDAVVTLDRSEVTPEHVGLKAYGLASLPSIWTRPFFVVPHLSSPTNAAITEVLKRLGIQAEKKFIVRSSGVDESMERRGALESSECSISDLVSQVHKLRQVLVGRGLFGAQPIHFVIQLLIPARAKGHLSNERRIAEQKRDWISELEASENHPVEVKSISLRHWRDSRSSSEGALSCLYRAQYIQCLTTVARWAHERLIRVHFEWVWDGQAIYLVQADPCDEIIGGVYPADLVQSLPKLGIVASNLQKFREVSPNDFQQYRKLANARLYRELGYEMVPFYVLDDAVEIRSIIQEGRCSGALLDDLKLMAARPLVIRTDGKSVPDELKQMLPRSEELRSMDQAERWLLNAFRQFAIHTKSDLAVPFMDFTPCLIAHQFVPATAAAWCQAQPDQRRVRIESLWGLPEGLYWYSYDAFDVDTQVSVVDSSTKQPSKMLIRERRRYKERFVAPDANGSWVLHKPASGPDWQRSIRKTEWIEEIAWASRRIAAKVGYPVVVMWFVDVPKAASAHRVLPWYHEQWRADSSLHKAAPRRKLSATTDFVLRTNADWTLLKERISNGDLIVRIRVRPDQPELVRDPKFAEELAAFAKQHKLVVELEGGMLSHAYYMLSRAGCTVECADLDSYASDDAELEFNKLVRDQIPSSIAAKGESVTVFHLTGEALIAALRRKLIEESLEVLDARTADDIADELADVREVVLSLMSRLGITEADVETRRRRKVKSRGAFDEALMLSKTTVKSSMEYRQVSIDADSEQSLISSTINLEAEIPSATEEIHSDRRVDSTGIAERQFTIEVPAHAAGYKPVRVAFSLPTGNGAPHEMVFELLLNRRGPNLRVRARVLNAAIQLQLDFVGGATNESPATFGKINDGHDPA